MAYKDFIQNNTYYYLADYPLECPECHQKTTPNYTNHRIANNSRLLYANLYCPNPNCEKSYIGEYKLDGKTYFFTKVIIGKPKKTFFSEEISTISPMFLKIYNESFTAEQMQLLEISGVGYRKALEFLIKDFLIKMKPDKSELIKKMFLGKCIAELVDDPKIKTTAKRAVWLGNDHTHYIKKWDDKDLADLKKLIRLTINWIESEILTAELETSMPE
ncbi:DUF4145 domain-containing protein [Gelidibacter salicanalis]|uniref:DUF4145 domain-containing protein n=1 Tax=Gelidibacter salicanalis TaxID=291193 RepID=A0A934NKP2_9FLAO|nr:DUF4145 domain-containing protein [Gelidibacter salicanalis]MBJ7881627.1 DUF4145 domain-containing protein [Gelidibacter salicanalis]